MITIDEVIQKAKLVGIDVSNNRSSEVWAVDLLEFAKQFVINERESFAKESLEVLDNLRKETISQCQQGMVEAYKLGQSEEREACAKVCDELKWHSAPLNFAENCAAAIRARSQHE